MSYNTDDIDLDTIFQRYTSSSSGTTNTDYKLGGIDFNNIYQRLGNKSNLKYWNSTGYYLNGTDLKDVFQYNLIGGTNITYTQYAIDNGTMIIITDTDRNPIGNYIYFNNTNKFNITGYVCGGGGGGGCNKNSGNAGGGGGGGGLQVFRLNQDNGTMFNQMNLIIGVAGGFSGGGASGSGTTGGDTNMELFTDATTVVLNITAYGGGGGGDGKNGGKNGGTGGGAGSGSNSAPSGGNGIVPLVTNSSSGLGYQSIFANGAYSGGYGQKQRNDNGGGGGGGGVTQNGTPGGGSGSGTGGDGYSISWSGGGGGPYATPGSPGNGGSGYGGSGTNGIQKGGPAEFSVSRTNNIYMGSGGGGVGNDGNSSLVLGDGNGAQGGIILVFTNK